MKTPKQRWKKAYSNLRFAVLHPDPDRGELIRHWRAVLSEMIDERRTS